MTVAELEAREQLVSALNALLVAFGRVTSAATVLLAVLHTELNPDEERPS